jgi:hypothetical protein
VYRSDSRWPGATNSGPSGVCHTSSSRHPFARQRYSTSSELLTPGSVTGAREFRQPLGDLGVTTLGDVLIAQRHLRRRVAEPVHEFGCGGAGLGGQHRTHMAKVVYPQAGHADRGAGFLPVRAVAVGAQMGAVSVGEQQGSGAGFDVVA